MEMPSSLTAIAIVTSSFWTRTTFKLRILAMPADFTRNSFVARDERSLDAAGGVATVLASSERSCAQMRSDIPGL